jgi:zinc protease
VHGLPDDYFDWLRQQVIEVDIDAVNEAAANRIKPDELVGIVVGDASEIADSVREAGVGPVEIVTDED